MEEIKNPSDVEIFLFDGVSAAGVYVGTMDCLCSVRDILKWRNDAEMTDAFGEPVKVLTLAEIKEQLSNYALVTVIVESAMSGVIYRVGNYSDNAWWQIGELAGYA